MSPLAERAPDSCLHELIRRQAAHCADAPAILAPGRTPLTYGRLHRQAEETVAALNALGIGRGDRVAIVLPEGPELAVATIAISAAATCAPLNPACRARELDVQLADLDCAGLVAERGRTSAAIEVARSRGIPVLELIPAFGAEAGIFTLRAAAPRVTRSAARGGFAATDEAALALHTSGTSARAKLVALSHANLCAAARSICVAVELTQGDRCLNVMPLFHIHGLSTLFASAAAGGSVICTAGFSAARFFEWQDELQPTWTTAAPAVHQAILAHAVRHPAAAARSRLRFLRSASAAMPPQLIAEMERVFRVPFVEAYGMTEAAPQIASNRLSPEGRRLGSVGRAAGPEVAIADEAGHFVATGVTGEIMIRGDNVIAAYAQAGDAGRDAFRGGWLRTGDLGRLDAEGFLFLDGRAKEIINRGGEKISPREVEAVLLDCPGVAQAAVFAVPHPVLGEGVAAAVVARGGADVTEAQVRQHAAARLAEFKVPQRVAVVAAIPLGPTGKLERIGLCAKLGVAPRTAIEEALTSVWADVLAIAPPGVHDNFFQLGGHSLAATQVIARARDELQVELSNDALFERPTIAELAELITRSPRLVTAATAEHAEHARTDVRPLSFAQEGLWFLDQLEPGNPAYNVSASLRLDGELDETALARSLDAIRRRHGALRTTFAVLRDQPVQATGDADSVALPIVDLAHLVPGARDAEARRIADEEARRPFDLARGPLFRATLLRLGAREHALLLTLHHIVADGWSVGVLHRELGALYAALSSGRTPTLPRLRLQYADFAGWQRDWLRGEALERQLGWWKEQLRGVPPTLALPADRIRPPAQSFHGAKRAVAIPRRVVDALKALSLREDATLFMTLLAAFEALLLRYTGQDDFLVGIPIANRTRVETEALIGCFANTLALRADAAGDPTFGELLGRVRATARGAYAHQDLPFEKLVAALHPARHPSRTPLLQVTFAFQNHPDAGRAAFALTPQLSAQPIPADNAGAKFDVTLYLWETGDGLAGAWQYNADLFDAATVDRMARHYERLLEAIVADPRGRLSQLPLLTDADRDEVLIAWNRTAAPHVTGCGFHELFEAQVERTPDAVAVECGDERLTYRELDTAANRLAWHLRRLGVARETLVGICLPRSADMPVALLAAQKAGGAYVPLDPEYPAQRLAFLMEDARVRILVTLATLVPTLAPPPGTLVVRLDGDRADIAGEAAHSPRSGATANDLAYVMYTSGSTGQPKGVMVTHANLVHCAQAMRDAVGVRADDRYLHTASFAFSSSVRQLAVPLTCGATMVVAGPDDIRDPPRLFDLVRRRRISVIDLVPSYWRSCIEELRRLAPSGRAALLEHGPRLILVASERLAPDLPQAWGSEFGHGARLVNMYGQTETTGIVAVHPLVAAEVGARAIPIGRPVANTQLYVLDAGGGVVPIGVAGEIHVGGAGVARGYLGAPELTAARFVPDPFRSSADARLYRTGDRGRYRPDGTLEFLDRIDDQLKVRGFRIEPGEVEAALREHPRVKDTAVLARAAGDAGTDARLVAFVVPRDGRRARRLTAELRAYLKGRLPDQMVPSAMIAVDALPLAANGKVDRRALAASAGGGMEPEGDGPRTVAERTLAAVWQDVLGLDRVGVHDNFFDLGGDSLLCVRMIRRANEAGLPLAVRQLFQHQTIALLARAAERGQEPSRPAAAGSTVRVTVESLRAYGREALEQVGVPPDGAAIVTEVQLESSLRGQPTHHMDSIPRYARRIAAGLMNPSPRIAIERESAISAQIDGDNGPGQWVAVVAMETAIRKARQSGIAVVSVRRSNHFGAAGHYVWLAARAGLIGLCTTNGPVILAPTGGLTPTFGNNPLGVGIPAGRHAPIVLDIAISVAPRGKIGLQLAEGKPLPPGWILDRAGRPSVDPADLVARLGVPIGGHKGYGIALVMEVLAGALSGSGVCRDHGDENLQKGSAPRDLGHFFLAIDPEIISPLAEFTARVDRIIDETKAGERAEGVAEILIPGETELRAREQNLERGVPLRRVTCDALRKYGDEARLASALVVLPE